MDIHSNSINWFEIPAKDIVRAKKFYEKIFEIQMSEMTEMMGMKMVGFPGTADGGKVNGALVQSEVHTPMMDGCVLYLNANPNIQNVIDRILSAGGDIVMSRTHISQEIGFMAFFVDTEGNKIGLHAQN